MNRVIVKEMPGEQIPSQKNAGWMRQENGVSVREAQ